VPNLSGDSVKRVHRSEGLAVAYSTWFVYRQGATTTCHSHILHIPHLLGMSVANYCSIYLVIENTSVPLMVQGGNIGLGTYIF